MDEASKFPPFFPKNPAENPVYHPRTRIWFGKMPMTDAITIRGVTKRFREKVAVKDLDLTVPQGSVCGFLGPNGAGKTTTIRMVMSIFYPDEGQISVLGKKSAIESKDLIGYLPEERGVYRKMKVGAFLRYIAKLKGVSGSHLDERIKDWLDRVELPDVQNMKCEELSKGMQQKVQFLATIIHDPELIILDEPFSGLDPVNVRLVRGLIENMHNAGKTIIFSTHVLHQAELLCDRVFMINNGEKILDGPMDEIRERFNPRTVVVEPVTTDPALGSTLEALTGVDRVSPRAENSGGFDLHLADDADVNGVMSRALESAPMRRVELRRATLEDIFVSLVDLGDSEDTVRAELSGAASVGAAV